MNVITIEVKRPARGTPVTQEANGLVVEHVCQCEMDECDMVARHVANDGCRMCDVCWEIENDRL